MLKLLLLTALASLALANEEFQPRFLEEMEGRVVGGEVAKPHSWPWQVSLRVQYVQSLEHICGGTLIRRGWVMTAAHCVDTQETYFVVLGEHNIRLLEGKEQFIPVDRVFIFPGWISGMLSRGNDIALLRLSGNASLNSYVQLGSLPPSGQILPHNNPCYITGWGLTKTGGSLSSKLKQASLPVVDHNTCSSSSWWGSLIKTTMVCAGGGSFSGCEGDSGGPLNCLVNGKYYVHGVASFVSAEGCNVLRKPTVFTRVSAYISWLENTMNKA